MVENSSNVQKSKSEDHASNNRRSTDIFDDDDLLVFALPWLSQPRRTIVRGPIVHGTTATIYQSSSGQIEREPQFAAHAGDNRGDEEEDKPKQLPNPTITTTNDDDTKIDEYFIRGKFARRAYHLPGNSYWQDYKQYITNCHLIFGLFCYDKRSPVRIKHRLLILFGSLAFGLNITNIIYLWGNQVFHDEEITFAFKEWAKTNIPTNNIYNGTTATNTILEDTILEDASARLKIGIGSQLTILWTAGAAIHAASIVPFMWILQLQLKHNK